MTPAAGLWFVAGLGLGALLAWFLTRRGEDRLRTQLEALLPRVAEAALAPKAQQLERAAGQELRLLGADTVHQVTASQAGLKAVLEDMRLRLEAYQARITDFEKERAGAQARLHQQLDAVAGAGAAMVQEARTLREALSTSGGVRGAWGEEVLKNILNACGLNESVDYHLQVGMEAGERRLRPDAVIHLPSGRNLVIDAKASLAAFLEGLEAVDEPRRLAAYRAFAQVLRGRAKELAGKDYSRNLDDSLPCVVMFVPSEGAFRAALDADPDLYRYGQMQQPAVVLASPSTLFPLIAIVAQGWQQQKASRQMQGLLDEVAEFGRRLQTFLGHVQSIGKGLDSAGKAYNAALTSYRSRLAPRWERLRELNAGWNEPEELKPAENLPILQDSE